MHHHPTSRRHVAARARVALGLALALALALVGPSAVATPTVVEPGDGVTATRSAAAIPHAVRVVTFPGRGLVIRRGAADPRRLRRTSPDFRTAVREALDQIWRSNGSVPRCATAPTVVVGQWRSDGWARVTVGMGPPCRGSSAWEIWRLRGSRHRVVLAGQNWPRCGRLVRAHVPVGLWDLCLRGDGVVHYGNPPSFQAVAGEYGGHTRSLTIRPDGRARAVIYLGCCDLVSDIDYLLLELRSTRSGAQVGTAMVSAVHEYDPDAFPSGPPYVWQEVAVRVAGGVVTLAGTTYCDADAPRDYCGA